MRLEPLTPSMFAFRPTPHSKRAGDEVMDLFENPHSVFQSAVFTFASLCGTELRPVGAFAPTFAPRALVFALFFAFPPVPDTVLRSARTKSKSMYTHALDLDLQEGV